MNLATSGRAALVGLMAFLLLPYFVLADGSFQPSHFVPGQNKDVDNGQSTTSIHAEAKDGATLSGSISTGDRGVSIDLHGQRYLPGAAPGTGPSGGGGPPGPSLDARQGTVQALSTRPDLPPPPVQTWTDDSGFHQISPNGQRADLAPADYSAAMDTPGATNPPHQDRTPMTLTIDGQPQGIVWMPDGSPQEIRFQPPTQTPPPDSNIRGNGSNDPYQVALDVLGHIPLPNIELRMNPGLGLVSMSGWFWVDNYDGRPFGASRTVVIPSAVPGQPPTVFTVTVTVRPAEYDWLFGDGGTLTTHSLGQPYPAESDVQHIYQYSSFSFAEGFPVDLTVHFAAQFQVNGGAPQPLPPLLHTFHANYPVQEAQAILQKPKGP